MSQALDPPAIMQRSRSRTPRDLKHFNADTGVEESEESDPSNPALGSEDYAWHFDMLHDDARLEAFCSAFDRLPNEVLQHKALDIGCGSGILGLALLQRRPELPEVIAYERDPTLAEVARQNAVKNGLDAQFTVHAVPSTDSKRLAGAKRAKLVVAEILDAALLGEDCLGTLRHAARCLLQDQYFAIPASADVLACAVESEVLASFQSVESAWWAPDVYRQDDGDANPHDVVLEKLVAAGQARVLTQGFPALFFNFEHLPETSGSKMLEVKLEASGRVDAIVFWWRCYMLRGDRRPSMTNAPWSTKPATKRQEIGHWRQAVCVLPQRRVVEAGATLSLMAFHTDEDIWFRIVEATDPGRDLLISLPRGSSTLGLMSPQRLWMLSNRQKYQQIQHAMDLAVKSLKSLHPGGAIQVLDLSDGPITTRLCLSSFRRCGGGSVRLRRVLQLAGRGPRIICLESNQEDLKVGKDVLKPWVKASLRCVGPKVLHVLGSPSLERKIISMVSGEPFAKECEGLPCDCQFWHHWAQVDALRFALKSSCIFLPRAFRVKAALLSCRDLWKRRRRISGPVQGVDVSAINELHPDVSGPQRFPCSLWQVEHAILSEAVTLCSIDMEMPFPDSQEFPQTTLRSSRTAKVDGIATWTEVCFSSAGWIPTARIIRARRDVWCFEPSPMMQGVLLARNPGCQNVVVQSSFDVEDGSLSLGATWADGRHQSLREDWFSALRGALQRSSSSRNQGRKKRRPCSGEALRRGFLCHPRGDQCWQSGQSSGLQRGEWSAGELRSSAGGSNHEDLGSSEHRSLKPLEVITCISFWNTAVVMFLNFRPTLIWETTLTRAVWNCCRPMKPSEREAGKL
eukprot:s4688_g2.t1